MWASTKLLGLNEMQKALGCRHVAWTKCRTKQTSKRVPMRSMGATATAKACSGLYWKTTRNHAYPLKAQGFNLGKNLCLPKKVEPVVWGRLAQQHLVTNCQGCENFSYGFALVHFCQHAACRIWSKEKVGEVTRCWIHKYGCKSRSHCMCELSWYVSISLSIIEW